jgi:hypothetical protein
MQKYVASLDRFLCHVGRSDVNLIAKIGTANNDEVDTSISRLLAAWHAQLVQAVECDR